jgi:hypothetical protein
MRETTAPPPSHLCDPRPVLDRLVAGQAALALRRCRSCIRSAVVVPAVRAVGAPHRGIRGVRAVPPHLASAVKETAPKTAVGCCRRCGVPAGHAQARRTVCVPAGQKLGIGAATLAPCPRQEPPFLAIKRPARPYKKRHTKPIYGGEHEGGSTAPGRARTVAAIPSPVIMRT